MQRRAWPASARHLSGAAHADASGQARTSQLPRSSNLSGKLIHVKSIREVTARGSGFWYHAYDVELATWTTTWADSGGTRTRTLHKYELLINEARYPGAGTSAVKQGASSSSGDHSQT